MENIQKYAITLRKLASKIDTERMKSPSFMMVLTAIDTNRPVFESDADKLSSSQMSMLRAVANGESRLNSSEVVNRYHLGGPQTITRNKRVLIEKDIIEKRGDGFDFVDPLFRQWIIRG